MSHKNDKKKFIKPNTKETKFTVYNEDGKKIAKTKSLESARLLGERAVYDQQIDMTFEKKYNQLGIDTMISPEIPDTTPVDLRSRTKRRINVSKQVEKALEVGAMQEVMDIFAQKGVGDNQVWEFIHDRQSLLEDLGGDIELAQQKIAESSLRNDDDIAKVFINGKNFRENIEGIKTDVIKVWETGSLTTPIEERAETWVKAKLEADSNFSKQLGSWRTEYEESTRVKAKNKYDDGGNLEWFSTLAVDYTFGAVPKNKIHTELRAILDKFKEWASAIFERAYSLNRFIEEGKVKPELINALTASISEKVKPVQDKKAEVKVLNSGG